jgi:hypothetical protein
MDKNTQTYQHPAIYPPHHIGVVGTPSSTAGLAGAPLLRQYPTLSDGLVRRPLRRMVW